jgi:hypothetical protein
MKFSLVVLFAALLLASTTFAQYPTIGSTSPRKDTACTESGDSIYGFYWDGQKCEQCSDIYSYCGQSKDYARNDYCASGYWRVTDDSNKQSWYVDGYCVSCDNSIVASDNFFANYYNKWGGVLNYEVGPRIVQCKNPYQGVKPWNSKYGKALRATKCTASTSMQGFRLFGSVCWYLPFCLSYNDFGQCT